MEVTEGGSSGDAIVEGARCARHTDSPAVAICKRCGDFVCGSCVEVVPGGVTYCEACSPPRVTLASRGWRLLAQVLDHTIRFGPGIIAMTTAKIIYPSMSMLGASLFLANPVIAFGIELYLLAHYGQSIGKRALGIMIIREDGTLAGLPRLVFVRKLLPWSIGLIPLLGPFFYLGNALSIFRDDRRCIHDMFAGTRVINAPARLG